MGATEEKIANTEEEEKEEEELTAGPIAEEGN